MPTRLREIIYFLNATNLKGRRKVASMLLNYGQDWRDIITSEIDNSLSAQRLTGKPKPFSTYGETRITLFSWQEGILNRDLALALEHTKAAMLVTNDSDRLLLEVFFENTGAMKGIDFKFLSLESLGEYELRKLRPVAETLRKNRIEKVKKDGGKIGRNAPCPCGSGKKYKKCCLISVSQPH
ncbi:MAG: SEC-C domain-containing protein [Deltaproteobacteria bacterium]|nr:SEC-C domain-containing protein [Deltaproteobacteria bacterium]